MALHEYIRIYSPAFIIFKNGHDDNGV